MNRLVWAVRFGRASVLPCNLLSIFILWYQYVFRPSGHEKWGDAAVIFYLAVLAYPITIGMVLVALLLARGTARTQSGRWNLALVVPLVLSAISMGLPWLQLRTWTG